jgi:hypothetical protein
MGKNTNFGETRVVTMGHSRRDYDDYFEDEPDFSVEDYVIKMANMDAYLGFVFQKQIEKEKGRFQRHILKNKLRGGYESTCLLLTACAKAKQIYNQSGNRLITEINTEFKQFTAFRRKLKALAQRSRYLKNRVNSKWEERNLK